MSHRLSGVGVHIEERPNDYQERTPHRHGERMTWVTPAEAAGVAHRHVNTIRKALESGELHGHQRGRRGRWLVWDGSINPWVTGATGTRECACAATNTRSVR